MTSWTTYKMADGTAIYGEYEWIDGLDSWFEDIDEPVELIKETWQLVTSETVVVKPRFWGDVHEPVDNPLEVPDTVCDACHEPWPCPDAERTVTRPDDKYPEVAEP